MADYLDDDENIRDMRDTAKQVGLTHLLRKAHEVNQTGNDALGMAGGLTAVAASLEAVRTLLDKALRLLGEK